MSPVPPQPPEKHRPAPLDYASPPIDPDRPAGGVPFGGQKLIGSAAFWWAAGSAIGLDLYLRQTVRCNPGAVPYIGAIIVLAALTVTAKWAWRWQGFVEGLMISVGIVVLVALSCLVMMLLSGGISALILSTGHSGIIVAEEGLRQ